MGVLLRKLLTLQLIRNNKEKATAYSFLIKFDNLSLQKFPMMHLSVFLLKGNTIF